MPHQLLANRYRLETELGRGGMGTVYRAHDTVLEREVAVKVLTASDLGSSGRARLLREAQMAASLDHPNIVSIYDAGEAEGTPYIVMQLVTGHSLHEQAPREVAQIVAIARQICAALEHAHARGIVHRDLKPENVLVTPDGTVKLMDFGLARSAASRLSAEGTVVGTVFYLAPEQALGHPVDGRADLYALGVLLFELLAGHLPFTGDDPLAIIAQHLHAPAVPPSTYNPDVPVALDILVVQLLSKRAADRPASAAVAGQALAELSTVAESLPPATTSLDRIARGRLVGRTPELAEGTRLWQMAVGGSGQVLLISGEPGIGKTRLARELVARAEIARATALTGECYAEGGTPYAPFAQILQNAVAHQPALFNDPGPLPATVLADLITLAPALRSCCPNVPTNPPLEPGVEQQRLFSSVVTLCEALCNVAPLLLLLEDVHWADSGTLNLVRHLARHVPRLRLLLILTYREVELDDARTLNDLLHEFTRVRLATRLKLRRLSQEQTQALLTTMFNAEISPDFLDSIYRETEGNPFFIEEVCKALVEEGLLYVDAGHWHRRTPDALHVPQSIRVAIQARVNRLPPAAQEVLRLAAIFGREFDYAGLAEVCDLPEDALIEALEAAERAQLIYEVTGVRHGLLARAPTLAFAHALIPGTLRETMSTMRRQRLHRRAALALEHLYPDRLAELAPVLGRHFAEAGDHARAADYLLQAGDRARALFAYTEAIQAYEQALEYLREQEQVEQAARTLMKLGLIYHTMLDFPRARQAYHEGFELWQQASRAPYAVTPLAPAPHALRLAWKTVRTLDPALAGDADQSGIVSQVYAGLAQVDPDQVILPDVAHMWEILEDGQRYVFHLRTDAAWTDGQPVTAHDFEFAWRRVLDPALNSPQAPLLYDVRQAQAFHTGQARDPNALGVRAVDPWTLVVDLEAPTSYFMHVLAHLATFPVPRHVVAAYGADWAHPAHLVSNGPYRLQEWEPGKRITFVRHSRYHDRVAGNIERVEIDLAEDWSNYPVAYESNQLDVISLGPSTFERMRDHHAGEYVSGPGPSTNYVGFDTSRPPMNDVRVRQALAHATDRETLAVVWLKGLVTPASGGFVPPDIPGHLAGRGLHYDPSRARQLLVEAGYGDGKGFPPVKLMIHDVLGVVNIGNQLVAQWRRVLGIEVELDARHDTYEALQRERPAMYFLGWVADFPDAYSFLRIGLEQIFHEWQNPTFAQLVDEGRRLLDPAQRVQRYQAAEQILIDEVPILPLFHRRDHLLIKPWLRNFRTSIMKTMVWKDLIIEPHT